MKALDQSFRLLYNPFRGRAPRGPNRPKARPVPPGFRLLMNEPEEDEVDLPPEELPPLPIQDQMTEDLCFVFYVISFTRPRCCVSQLGVSVVCVLCDDLARFALYGYI